MHIRIAAILLSIAGACSAASITGSIAADLGGSVDLTALGIVDWAHFGFPGQGTGGPNPAETEKIGGTVIGTPTSTRGIFKFYNFSPNTYSWTDGTPNASASITNGMAVNDGAIGGGFTEILLPAAAGTTPMRLVLYLGTLFFGGSQGAPLATLTATLDDGSGASFSIGNISDHNIVTLDYTADAASTLTVSFGSTALRESGGPETLLLDAAYVQLGEIPTDPGGGSATPEPSALSLFLVGGIPVVLWRCRRNSAA